MGILRSQVLVILMYMDGATRHNSEPKENKKRRQSLQSINMQEADSRSESDEDKEGVSTEAIRCVTGTVSSRTSCCSGAEWSGNRRAAFGSGTIPYSVKAHHHHTLFKSQ